MAKSSLYDMVSMIIPGFLFILCVKEASGIEIKNEFDSITTAIIVFSFSWIVGFVLHYISKRIFNPILRNRPKDIIDAEKETDRNVRKESDLKDYYLKYYTLMPSYTSVTVPILEAQVSFFRSMLVVVLAGVYAMIVKANSSYCFDNASCWVIFYVILMLSVCGVMCGIAQYHCNKYNLCVWKMTILTGFILFPLALFYLYKSDIEQMTTLFYLPNCLTFHLLLLLEVIMFFIMYDRQTDIYRRIFEDFEYIHIINTKKKQRDIN